MAVTHGRAPAILDENQAAFVRPGDGAEVSLGITAIAFEHVGEPARLIKPAVPLLRLVEIDRLVGLQRDPGPDSPSHLEFHPDRFVQGVHLVPCLGHDQRAFVAVKAGEVFPSQQCAAIIGRDLADTPQPIQAIEGLRYLPDRSLFYRCLLYTSRCV